MRATLLARAAQSALPKGRLAASRSSVTACCSTGPTQHHNILRAESSSTSRFYRTSARNNGTAVVPSPPSADGVLKSMYRDIDIPNINLSHYIMANFDKFGDKPAMVDGASGRTITFEQLRVLVQRAASALVRMGIVPGDVVTIFSPNLPEYAIIYLATVAMGGIVSCLNPLYTPGELKHAVEHSKSKMCVTIPQLMPVVKAATEGNDVLKHIMVFGEAEGALPVASLLKDDGSLCPNSPTSDPKGQVAVLPFSSGTTGLPKAVMLSHHNIISNIEQTSCSKEMISYDPDRDTLLGLLPFFHIFGQVAVMLAGLRNGIKVVTMPKFDPEPFLQLMQAHRVTTLHVAPPLVIFLAKHPYVDMFNLKHMHTMVAGAAPVAEPVVHEMVDRLKIPEFYFRQGFGMTECSPVTHVNPRVGIKYGSCGVAVHNTEFKIMDLKTNKALGQDQQGELWVRGPQVMLGYLNNEKATKETLDADGWLHTGDLAHYDADQHVVITDRLKELIKTKGFQVAPAELEEILLTHPSIGDAAVIGIPDDRAGELPRAYIVQKPGSDLTEDAIKAFVKGKVAPYKQLEGGIQIQDAIPKNLSGKILRRQLKEEYLASHK